MAVVHPSDVDRLRTAFPSDRPTTVGLEEELMLLDPATLDLAPQAPVILQRLGGDARFKAELPAAQLEIAGAPTATVAEAASALHQARRALVAASRGEVLVAGAGAHPFAAGEGEVMGGRRYAAIVEEYGCVARRQLVFGLHVHVAIAGADRALAVYNALREQLPALAALAAGSPFYEGRDTGLASVRPKLCDLLPRQGVPPAIPSVDALADALAWGRRSGRFADHSQWWWEARLHPGYGTLEVRVCDTQATIADTAALAAVVQALAVTLAERHDAGELAAAAPAPTWRIAENRWSACRHGVEGEWVDVRTGDVRPMRDHLHELLDAVRPVARRLGCDAQLQDARDLVEHPRPARARAIAAAWGGPVGLARWLAERFAG